MLAPNKDTKKNAQKWVYFYVPGTVFFVLKIAFKLASTLHAEQV